MGDIAGTVIFRVANISIISYPCDDHSGGIPVIIQLNINTIVLETIRGVGDFNWEDFNEDAIIRYDTDTFHPFFYPHFPL